MGPVTSEKAILLEVTFGSIITTTNLLSVDQHILSLIFTRGKYNSIVQRWVLNRSFSMDFLVHISI